MVINASIIIFNTDLLFDNHHASGKPTSNNNAVVIVASFKVSQIGDRSMLLILASISVLC